MCTYGVISQHLINGTETGTLSLPPKLSLIIIHIYCITLAVIFVLYVLCQPSGSIGLEPVIESTLCCIITTQQMSKNESSKFKLTNYILWSVNSRRDLEYAWYACNFQRLHIPVTQRRMKLNNCFFLFSSDVSSL